MTDILGEMFKFKLEIITPTLHTYQPLKQALLLPDPVYSSLKNTYVLS